MAGTLGLISFGTLKDRNRIFFPYSLLSSPPTPERGTTEWGGHPDLSSTWQVILRDPSQGQARSKTTTSPGAPGGMQSVKHLTLDFGSGHDLTVHVSSSPTSVSALGFSLSLSL